MTTDFYATPAGQISVVILFIWSLFWKGIALWRSAKYDQKYWFLSMFVTILVVNTLGILEIIYLFRFAKKRMTVQELSSYFTNLSLKNSISRLKQRK